MASWFLARAGQPSSAHRGEQLHQLAHLDALERAHRGLDVSPQTPVGARAHQIVDFAPTSSHVNGWLENPG
jgi:hypothetical protein